VALDGCLVDQNVGNPTQLDHFLVDTSRNGLGAWTPPAGKYTGDAQTWCNPPVRAVGARPTADTGIALVDAYLHVKMIGQSDGSCTRGTAGPGDPEYGGTVDHRLAPGGPHKPDPGEQRGTHVAFQPARRAPAGDTLTHRLQRLDRSGHQQVQHPHDHRLVVMRLSLVH
jgi:hypothetical protein